LFFVPLAGPLLAIVFGVAALVDIAGSRGELKGSGLAIAGILMGALFLVATCLAVPFGAALVLPRLKHDALRATTTSNLRHIGLAVLMYDADYEAMPPDLEILYSGGYVRDVNTFNAPGEEGRAFAGSIDDTTGYYYTPMRRSEDEPRPYPANAPIAWEKRPRHPDGLVSTLTAGGAVVRMGREALKAAADARRELYLETPVLPD
jgi:hypothetical protein